MVPDLQFKDFVSVDSTHGKRGAYEGVCYSPNGDWKTQNKKTLSQL